uniref:Uncharacterized protein n=1 Tax=Anopheles merus TaxID=30066 RepID=A0A9I3MH56_ANOME
MGTDKRGRSLPKTTCGCAVVWLLCVSGLVREERREREKKFRPEVRQAKSVCGQVGVRTCVPVCVYECVFVICVCVCVRVCRVGSAGKCNSRIPLNRIREESSSIHPSASQTASNIEGARIRQKNRHRRSASSSSNERNRIKTAPGDGEVARKRVREKKNPTFSTSCGHPSSPQWQIALCSRRHLSRRDRIKTNDSATSPRLSSPLLHQHGGFYGRN